MVRADPDAGYLPSGEVGHHAAPGTGDKIIDGRAGADRRGHGVNVNAVDHGGPVSQAATLRGGRPDCPGRPGCPGRRGCPGRPDAGLAGPPRPDWS